MEVITVEIDGIKCSGPGGSTVLDMAKDSGIDIPTLCYEPRLTPYGACRLCLVEVEGARGLLPACYAEATEGMVVNTTTENLERIRKTLVELLVSDHQMECQGCAKSGRCELQKLANRYGVTESGFKGKIHEYEILEENPFVTRDYNKCVTCGRCVRICREVQGVGVYEFVNRGFKTVPGTPYEKQLPDTPCEFCGQCISTCPTGALKTRPYEAEGRVAARDMLRNACAYFQMSEDDMMEALGLEGWKVRTTCAYCGCGCQLDLHVIDNQVVEVTSPLMVGAGQGNLCVKGRFGYDFIGSDERLKKPMVRKDGRLVETGWDEALDLVTGKLSEIKGKSGADSIAILSSARITNEENYLIQKFTRAVLSTNNVDHCARLCHAPTVAGLAKMFGSGAMTNAIDDIEEAGAILVIGSNTTEAHPIIGLRVKKAVMQNGCKLIVAEPRRIRLCYYADKFLQHKPGTDVALINGMMNVIIEENLYDKNFVDERTEGFEEIVKLAKEYTPEKVAEICGVDADDIREAARVFANAERAAIIYAMGITQHTTGTDNVVTLANLSMLTGNIGKPGAGVNPLRGQNNVQGACDMGALPNVLTGYRSVTDPDARKPFEDAWGVTVPTEVGLTATEMMDAASRGDLKAMYVIGENPMMSDPNLKHAGEALDNLEFLVVQDIFLTETARRADVVLPSASFAEKDGTFTTTDRRVQMVRKAVEPPGEAKTDYEIIGEISKRMGYEMATIEASGVMDEIANLTPQYGGVSHARLDGGATVHWPCPDAEHPGTPILHTKQFTRGKGLFCPAQYKPPAEEPDAEYPLILTTGRVLWQYHTGTMTRKSKGINEIDPHGKVWISPADAEKFGIESGVDVVVSTRRGEIDIEAMVTKRMPDGVIFVPFHYVEAAANTLTNNVVDPVSKIPEFKVSAAKVKVK
ncbi:MAG: formate dehydrogenase subunit alpha [Candidatus Anoxymicrobium japonicum]|uniref:Formate dehydrogenase subunit alpha n=1 Tax=Candidatus Anoxymicrobium japonicum TaxID=2013648 RepID=A0A2N3G541_9ACTN|nr:MAG: formate dehydrogenase subunit alpha [Candidatus Anoxymicrobium japonicum]